MPSPEKQSPINKWEDSNMLSKIKVLPSDTSKTATWYQDRLLNSLLEKNSVEFNDLVNQKYIDINYFYGAPHNGTLLDIACRTRDMSEFVKSILEKEVDVNAINEITGKAAIHEAIENSAVDVVDILIQYGFLINIEDRDGNTPLHSAIKQNNLQIIKLLLENNHQRIDINISNRQNPTPLHIALLEGYTEAAIMLLKYPYVDLDFQTDSEGHTCRQIIHQRYPKLEEELHTNLTKIAADPVEILASLLKRGEIEIFIEVASKMSTKFLDDNEVCKYGGTFLQLACFYGYVDVVDMLLRKGVDPNKASIRTYIPILIAAKYGYYDIFVKLLNHPKIDLKISGGESSLHQLIRGMFLLKHRDGSQHLKCLELLLNKIIPQAQLDIDYVNKEGYTALHYAVLLNDECVIKSLIYAGAHLYHKNSRGEIPLTSIKANILEDYLDQCISSRNNFFFARDFEITFDYTIFVQPSKFHQPERHETEFFTIIEGVPELRMLLKHPVSKSFLHVKWYLVRKYYYINFIIYLIFCSMLSWYIFQIHQGTWSPIINDSPILNTSSSNNDYTLYYGPSIIMIFNGIVVLRELSQFCVSPKTYIKSLENWMEILVILATCGLLALVNTDNANERSPISAFIIIICWIELIFLLGKHPTFSNYIETFKTVTLNFLKYLSVYLLLIVSFAFSFYILFKSHTQLNDTSFKNQTNTTTEINIDFWQDPKLSFLKSIVMLTGEFSTDDTIPLGQTFASRHLFFLLFIFLITIVLYNLLNGLAISDIQAIRADAELITLVSQVKLISQLERFAMFNPCRYLHHLIPSRFSYPQAWLLIIGDRCTSFYNTLFLEKITMYPLNKIHVLPYVGNSIRFYRELSASKEKSNLKMPSSIVKQAMQILENRNEFDAADKSSNSLQMHTIKNNLPRFKSIDKLSQDLIAQIREMNKKIDERDEKLIQKMSNFMTNFESKIDKRIDKLMESIEELKTRNVQFHD